MKTTSDTATQIAIERFQQTAESGDAGASSFALRMYWIGAARGAVSAEFACKSICRDGYKFMLEVFKAWEDLAFHEYLNWEK